MAVGVEGTTVRLPRRRHRIGAARRPRVAAAEPARAEPAAAQHAVGGDGLVGVGRAGRVVAARARGPGRDHPLVDDDQREERGADDPGRQAGRRDRARRRWARLGVEVGGGRAAWLGHRRASGPGCGRSSSARRPRRRRASSRSRTRSRSAPSSAEPACGGRGLGAQDQQRPGRRAARRGCSSGGGADGSPGCARRRCRRPWTRPGRPEPAQRAGEASAVRARGAQVGHQRGTTRTTTGTDRATEVVAAGHAVRGGQHRAGSTEGVRPVRPRARRGPCGDGRRGSNGRPGSASAAGSRGSWPADGCSAGRCACSLGTPDLGTAETGRCLLDEQPKGGLTPDGCHRTPARETRHGHATPAVDRGRRSTVRRDPDHGQTVGSSDASRRTHQRCAPTPPDACDTPTHGQTAPGSVDNGLSAADPGD